MGTVYLLHFDRPLAHARHYLGFTEDLEARLEKHRKGTGARLVQVMVQAGASFVVARTWDGGRELERRLKNWHKSRELCPICKGGKCSF